MPRGARRPRPRPARRARSPPPRSGEACRSSYGRHSEEPVFGVRGVRERLLERERRRRLVLGEHVDEVEWMRGWGHALEIELADLSDRLEDRRQLLLEPADLLLRQREARELRDVQHLVPRNLHERPSSQKSEGPPYGGPWCKFRKGSSTSGRRSPPAGPSG